MLQIISGGHLEDVFLLLGITFLYKYTHNFGLMGSPWQNHSVGGPQIKKWKRRQSYLSRGSGLGENASAMILPHVEVIPESNTKEMIPGSPGCLTMSFMPNE